MHIARDHFIDERTGLPNFIAFFTADYNEIYGDYGTLLRFRVKSLRILNNEYGRSYADELLKRMGGEISKLEDVVAYRNEGNEFLLVYKEQDETKAIEHETFLKSLIDTYKAERQVEEGTYYAAIASYDKTFRSMADYYRLFYESYIDEEQETDGKVLMHKVLSKMSYRINDIISEYEDARSFAFYDEISCLPNSKSARHYLEDLEVSYDSFTILFIDGDSLKKFNDISYDEGNNAIKRIAKIIQTSIRKSDKVFRWLSGDEFIVVAKDISLNETSLLAERIRKNVQDAFIKKDIRATVSLGISIYPDDGATVDSVIDKAEKANKRAKDKGKNCYVYYSECSKYTP